MGSRKFTLIELHLDGETQFGPQSIGEALPAFGRDADVEGHAGADEDTDDTGGASEDDSSGKPIAALVGLVVFVGLAIAFRKLRGGDDGDEVEDLERDEPDVVVN